MPTYVHLVNYTSEGVENIIGGGDRLEQIREAAREAGGDLSDVFLTFGQYDLVGISEFPSDEAAAQFALTASAMGGSDSETLKAFTEDEFGGIVAAINE